MVKMVIPVASLNTASVSISVESFRGSFARLKISRTVAVSVGAMMLANRKDGRSGS